MFASAKGFRRRESGIEGASIRPNYVPVCVCAFTDAQTNTNSLSPKCVFADPFQSAAIVYD